jgi:hypothetical protein
MDNKWPYKSINITITTITTTTKYHQPRRSHKTKVPTTSSRDATADEGHPCQGGGGGGNAPVLLVSSPKSTMGLLVAGWNYAVGLGTIDTSIDI